jgi:hypothetical protein
LYESPASGSGNFSIGERARHIEHSAPTMYGVSGAKPDEITSVAQFIEIEFAVSAINPGRCYVDEIKIGLIRCRGLTLQHAGESGSIAMTEILRSSPISGLNPRTAWQALNDRDNQLRSRVSDRR